MVCWVVPLMTMLIVSSIRKLFHKRDDHTFWLNIMLLGGTVFGLIDHIWNGELFLIGSNWMMDLALGSVITGGIGACWCVIIFKPQLNDILKNLNKIDMRRKLKF